MRGRTGARAMAAAQKANKGQKWQNKKAFIGNNTRTKIIADLKGNSYQGQDYYTLE